MKKSLLIAGMLIGAGCTLVHRAENVTLDKNVNVTVKKKEAKNG